MSGRQFRPVVCAVFAVVALVAGMPEAGASPPSVLEDPVGDAAHHAPAYLDIVRAEVAKVGGTFLFVMELAGDVPGSPSLTPPAGSHVLAWAWGLAKDSKPYPRGYPFAPGYPDIGEVIVGIVWDGAAFAGLAIDRMPDLSGGDAVVTAIDFALTGSRITARVGAADIGDPPAFVWGAFTVTFHGPFGRSAGYNDPDVAVWAAWPS